MDMQLDHKGVESRFYVALGYALAWANAKSLVPHDDDPKPISYGLQFAMWFAVMAQGFPSLAHVTHAHEQWRSFPGAEREYIAEAAAEAFNKECWIIDGECFKHPDGH